MELYIETLTGTAFELRVNPNDTVMSIKSKIQRFEGMWLDFAKSLFAFIRFL